MGLKNIRKPFLLGLSLLSVAVAATACTGGGTAVMEEQPAAGNVAEYHKISAEEAKAVMDSDEAVIVLDVREQSEYDAGHIPGATLLPSGNISAKAASVLPDKDMKILVYCRSGSRSRMAANELVKLGYTNVYDFGGIIDWPYDVVKD